MNARYESVFGVPRSSTVYDMAAKEYDRRKDFDQHNIRLDSRHVYPHILISHEHDRRRTLRGELGGNEGERNRLKAIGNMVSSVMIEDAWTG